jgi:ATP-dependent Lhr-like helicase
MAAADGTKAMEAWFATLGRTPFAFQRETWHAFLDSRSGLLHAPTGSGKTLAVFGGPMIERLNEGPTTIKLGKRDTTESFRVIWITPMRALATDTTHALTAAVKALGLNWSVELRTSDTTSAARKKQRERLPTVLVTTPESLSLLISYEGIAQRLVGLKAMIIDEWHELLSTKRGTQTELGLARLRTLSPSARTWGLSATIGNLAEAKDALLGASASQGLMVHAIVDKEISVETLIPESIEKFPWGGHMGLRMVGPVIKELEKGGSTLIFTNTRAQTEIWFRELMNRRPDWVGHIGVHHGSLDRKVRAQVENLIRDGRLRAVVCTSSLDLGVDFSAVDRVIQVGSPKGIGRIMQRAGRSGHRPGEPSRVICVPTHAFELIEFSSVREGIAERRIESRKPLDRPLDVLVQHLVTVAAGGGFDEAVLREEVRATHAYRNLSDEEWGWAIDFVARGGPTLTAYPRFSRVSKDETGRWIVADDRVARMHRLGIGTISGDGVVAIVTTGGKRLGTLEESYMGRLKPGDYFVFAGQGLELVGLRQMVARVRPAKRQGTVPAWPGGKFPMSTMLALGVRQRLDEARRGIRIDNEMEALKPLLDIQQRFSILPSIDQLLIETTKTREGYHAFIFGFFGRLVHEGLGALLAYRVRRRFDQPVTATFTDYGLELLCPNPIAGPNAEEVTDVPLLWKQLLSSEHLLDDLLACLNTGELTKRQFRDIARVAGLILSTSPGAPRTVRHLQASSELFFDVFREFDPENLLLLQAQREVLEQQLEVNRLKTALDHAAGQKMVIVPTKQLTPMAFPIWAQRIQSQTLRGETASSRIERMIATLEKAANTPGP